MKTRDVIAERAHMHKRVQVLIGFIGRLHRESYDQRQRIAALETALRKTRQRIHALAEHGLIHRYRKGGYRRCVLAKAGQPWNVSLRWEDTTCPACLETRAQDGG